MHGVRARLKRFKTPASTVKERNGLCIRSNHRTPSQYCLLFFPPSRAAFHRPIGYTSHDLTATERVMYDQLSEQPFPIPETMVSKDIEEQTPSRLKLFALPRDIE